MRHSGNLLKNGGGAAKMVMSVAVSIASIDSRLSPNVQSLRNGGLNDSGRCEQGQYYDALGQKREIRSIRMFKKREYKTRWLKHEDQWNDK